MNKTKIVKVFIGSPSDTINERNKISEIIEELNQTIGYNSDILVQSIMWENNVRPTIGLDGQDVINSQTQDYEIFVGMMWKKYGSPTPRAGSATDEEYTHALESFRSNGHCKDIIFMFSKMPFNSYEVEADQLAKVQTFRKRIEKDGVLHKDYDSIDDFAKQLKVALFQSITKLEQTSCTKEQNVPKPMRLEEIDEKTKLVFDTLSISPAVNSVKMKFIESYILLYLYDNESASSNDIINYLMVTLGGTNEHLYNNVLGRLNQTDSICNIKNETKQFKLTDTKREEIAQIKEKAHLAMDKVSHECQLICAKYNLDLDVSQINIYVCNLFATNYSNDTGEFCRGSINRESSLKQIYASLVQYIRTASRLPIGFVEPIAKEIVGVYSKNQVFSPQKISEMISLIDFKVDPTLVDENIISLTESNFNTSNDTISFLDLLNSIIDQGELGDWKLAKKLTKLRELCKGGIGDEGLSSTNLPIDEIINEILHHSFGKAISTSDINELFCDNDYANEISDLIQAELKDYKIGISPVKKETFKKLERMVQNRKERLEELSAN